MVEKGTRTTERSLKNVGIHFSDIMESAWTLGEYAEDSYAYEKMLDHAIRYMLETIGGHENYGGENPKMGRVRISRFDTGPGVAAILYEPSPRLREELGYVQAEIGRIDLRRNTYEKIRTPGRVWNDLGRVLEELGLSPE